MNSLTESIDNTPDANSPAMATDRPRRWGTRRRGALTVEFALCLPLLFLFLFGCYEICHVSMLQHAAESAAYEAARAGVVPGATPEQCRNAAGFVLRSVGISSFTVDVVPNNIAANTPVIRVDISVPLRANSSFASFFFRDPVFRGSCELVRETL